MRFIAKTTIYLLGLCLAGGAWLVWSYHQPSVDATAFERASWLDGAATLEKLTDPGCVRGAMAIDLIDSRRLIGMKSQALADLLGPPMVNGAEWIYPLGQCSGFGWEHSRLVIQMDGEHRAILAQFQREP